MYQCDNTQVKAESAKLLFLNEFLNFQICLKTSERGFISAKETLSVKFMLTFQ